MNDNVICEKATAPIFCSRAPLVIDILVIATVLVALLLAYSIFSVRVRRNYQRHRRLQIFISVLLLVVLIFFEVSMHLHGWRGQAAGLGILPLARTLADYAHRHRYQHGLRLGGDTEPRLAPLPQAAYAHRTQQRSQASSPC